MWVLKRTFCVPRSTSCPPPITMVCLQMCKILLYFCAVIYWLHNCTININYQCKLGVTLRTLHIVLCPKNRSDFLTYCQYRIYLNNAQKYRIVFCIFWPPPIYIHSVPSPTPHISHTFSSSTLRIFRSRNHFMWLIRIKQLFNDHHHWWSLITMHNHSDHRDV